MSGPFVNQGRCICCPDCITGGTSGSFCNGQYAPEYMSLRLSTGYTGFLSDVPIEWDEGAHEYEEFVDPGGGITPSGYLYYFVAQWLKKHTQGEGPDIVLELVSVGSTTTYSERIAFSSMVKSTFTAADVSNLDNDSALLAPPAIPSLDIRLQLTSSSLTLKMGFDGYSDEPFFSATQDSDVCSWIWPVSNQLYVAVPNGNNVDPEYSGDHTDAAAMNRRAWGGTAYIRPCSVNNALKQGLPWMWNDLHVASGELLPCVKTSFSAPIDLEWCLEDYPGVGLYANFTLDDTLELTHDEGTISGSWDADPDPDLVEQGVVSCGGADTGSPSNFPITGLTCELGYCKFDGVVLYCFPWASTGFNPITGSIADGVTLEVYLVIAPPSGTATAQSAGTITIPALETTGTCCPVYSDATKCVKWEDASGFKVKKFRENADFFSANYWVKSIAGFDEITADNAADFELAMQVYYPSFTISVTAHGTSPLVSKVEISGVSGTWKLTDDTDTERTMVAC